jgi:ABC-type lipoprotein release transport system permease subunit
MDSIENGVKVINARRESIVKRARLVVMAWRNLWRNPRRTILTLVSIIFGVFLAVLVTAMQDRNWSDTINLAARIGSGHITLQHPDYLEAPRLTNFISGVESLIRICREDPGVTRAVPRIAGQVMLRTADESREAGMIAFDPAFEDDSTLALYEALEEGKFFSSSKEKGIILGQRLAQILGTQMGKRVVYTLTDVEGEIVSGLARVSGIIRTGAPTIDGGLCLLPIDSVREVLGYSNDDAVHIAVFVDDHRRSEEIAARIRERIGGSVSALPWFEVQPELAGFIAMKVGGARFIEILIAVLVAAGIFNTLFISVMERIREFGILLALGFSPGRLFRLVMLESLWMALVGLIAAAVFTAGPYYYLNTNGIDLSSLMPEGNTEVAGVALSTTIKVGIFMENALMIFLFALFAVILSGLYPAWKAARVAPVEAIKIG